MRYTALYRFMIRATITDGCWEWVGAKTPDGFGMFSEGGRNVSAQRYAYEVLVGKTIPKGYRVVHLCKSRGCVNPKHLDVQTPSENMKNTLSGFKIGLMRRLKKKCPKGHPYDKENTYLTKIGGRGCRECQRNWSRNYQRRINAQ